MPQPLKVEVQFLGKELNLVVPKQPGVDFETAAPRLAALAEKLQAQYRLPVNIIGGPERHLHGPADQHVSFGSRNREHTH